MNKYFGPQPPQAWLFSIEEKLRSAKPGASYDLWSEPPRDDATGDLRLRSDGSPYTPHWTVGDDLVIHHP